MTTTAATGTLSDSASSRRVRRLAAPAQPVRAPALVVRRLLVAATVLPFMLAAAPAAAIPAGVCPLPADNPSGSLAAGSR